MYSPLLSKIFLLSVPVFLLSGCMKLDSDIVVSSSGATHSIATMDMSKMVALLSAFGTGATGTGIDKDLCRDESFQQGLAEGVEKSHATLENLACTSLGDYKARIEGDMNLSNRKGALFLSGGVIILDMLSLGEAERSSVGSDVISDGGTTAEDMGFSIHQTYTVPGNIAYKEVGTLSGSSILVLNLLDPKVLYRRSAILIATPSGDTLSPKEINMYKLQLRKHNRKIR